MLLISCQGSAGVLRMTSNNRRPLFLAFCVMLCRKSCSFALFSQGARTSLLDAVRNTGERGGWFYYMILIGQKVRGNACCLPWPYCKALFLEVGLSLQKDLMLPCPRTRWLGKDAPINTGTRTRRKHSQTPEEEPEGSFKLLNTSSLFKWAIRL